MKLKLPQIRFLIFVLSGLGLLFDTAYVSPTIAQTFSPPLIIQSRGDLYTWLKNTNTLTRLTQTGLNTNPVMSPDGKHLAFFAVPDRHYIDCSRQVEQDYCNNLPLDVWLMNLETLQATRITNRSPVLRASLAWSPDGQQLAWWEHSNEVLMYDVGTKKTVHLIRNLPVPFGDAGNEGIADISWGSVGIAVNGQSGEEKYVGLYNASGTKRFEWHFSLAERNLVSLTWVYDKDKSYLLAAFQDSTSSLLDPYSGKTKAVDQLQVERSTSSNKITPPALNLRYQAIQKAESSMGRQVVDLALGPDGSDLVLQEVDNEKSLASIACWCDSSNTRTEITTQPLDERNNFPYGLEMAWVPTYLWLQ